jgi:hypothetical protein
VLFLWWWWLVLGRTSLESVRLTGVFILGTLVLCVTMTGLWAAHNVAIYKRRGPRTRVRHVQFDFSRDRLGRPVSFGGPLEQMEIAPIVHIRLDNERKIYRTALTVPSVTVDGSAIKRPERTHDSR